MRSGWSALALVAVLASPARAADTVDDLLREGITLRRAGRDEEALPKFEQAYRMSPSPRAAAQLGLCKQALGHWSEAEETLDEALKAPADPWVSKNRPALEQALATAREHIGRVEVVGEPAGAEVIVSGRRRGTLPLPRALHVNAGSVDVEVHAAGYERAFRTVTVAPAGFQTVVVHLQPDARPAAGNGAAGALAAGGGTLGHDPLSPNKNPTPDLLAAGGGNPESGTAPRPLWKRGWFWGAVGAVVVGGVVAAVLLTRSTTYPSSNVSGTFP